MNQMWPWRFVAAVALILVTSGWALASHQWGTYHWARTKNPFNIGLVDNVTNDWGTPGYQAVLDWSISQVLEAVVLTGSEDNTTRYYCTAPTGKIAVCNYGYGVNGWAGISQIWIDSNNHITKSSVKLNDSYAMSPDYKRYVVCQEIGHSFGLLHNDENPYNTNTGTCMDYGYNLYGPPSNLRPNVHDYEQLNSQYAHLDWYNTVAPVGNPPLCSPSLGQAVIGEWVVGDGHGRTLESEDDMANMNDPYEWGTLVHVHDFGLSEEYERVLRDGGRVLTHVDLVEEEADRKYPHLRNGLGHRGKH